MVTTVVRLRRRGGEIVRDADIFIGRRTVRGGWDLPQSPFANPYSVKRAGSALAAVRAYYQYILNRPDLLERLEELRDKRLGCWCKDKGHELCHGDVLVALLHGCTEWLAELAQTTG